MTKIMICIFSILFILFLILWALCYFSNKQIDDFDDSDLGV